MLRQTKIGIQQKSKLLEGLNAEQEKAVTHPDGPLLIVAGAGTGKTTVITRRIAYLIEQGAKPEEILALAFGEKAAGEMEERVEQLLPVGYFNQQISTFHAFGEEILHEYGIEIGLPDFKVLDEIGQWLLVRRNLDIFDLDYYRPIGNPTKFVNAMLSHFSRLKDELIGPDEYFEYAEKGGVDLNGGETQITSPRINEIAGAYHTYNKLLLDNSAMDFGDLINYTLDLLKKRPMILERLRARYQYILVDEFQDTNLAQYELIKLLAATKNNITVVGDDDQSIYKFRGASISNILHFQQDYPGAKFISLTENYRSGQKILDSAYGFIQANNPDRLEVKLKLSKKLKSRVDGNGEVAHLPSATYLDEVETVMNKIVGLKSHENITYNDFAILSRSHIMLDPFLNRLDTLQIPYIYFANKGLYNKPIILDLLSYFRLLDNYHENTALFRVLKFPTLKIASRAIIELGAFAKRKSLSLFSAVKQFSSFDLDDESQIGIRKLLEFIDRHSELARIKTTDELFVSVVNDLHFSSLLKTDSMAGLQNARYLEMFRRRVQNFQSESPDKHLKTFMTILSLELEAGEEGDLQFDPEAGPEAVKLMTVHAAKGLEFKYVFVVGLVDKRFPSIERREQIDTPLQLVKEILPEGDIHLEEERRLFYVAMTRAKQGLYLTSAEDYGGKRKKRPSVFLHELGLVKDRVKPKATGKVELRPKLNLDTFRIPLPKAFYYSQISCFKKCPLEYKYRYILNLPHPGSASLSFGSTVHKTFEKFLNLYHQRMSSQDLFGTADAELPPFEILKRFYEESWIDDWYDNAGQKEQFKNRGQRIMKDFYNECLMTQPRPKYIEKRFKLKLGDHYFTGKIDRGDATADGLLLIDYKTGAPRPIEKVEKEQLLIYQWAAEELGEKVHGLEYWFLEQGLDKIAFLGDDKDIENVKAGILQNIEDIIDCTKRDNFLKIDQQTSHRIKCKFIELET